MGLLLSYLTLGWIGVAVAHASRGEDREWGKDRIFPLPLHLRYPPASVDQSGRIEGSPAPRSAVPASSGEVPRGADFFIVAVIFTA